MKITECLGNSSRVKVIEFLIKNKDKGLSLTEIIRGANVKYRNLIDTIKDLVIKEIIYVERKIGKSNLYKINESNSIIEGLMFAQETADAATGECNK